MAVERDAGAARPELLIYFLRYSDLRVLSVGVRDGRDSVRAGAVGCGFEAGGAAGERQAGGGPVPAGAARAAW